MGRRMITSEIFKNEKFGSLTDTGRLLFIGCFTNADDDGRLKASPKYLKVLIFPYDEDKTAEDIKSMRDRLHELGLIQVYSNNGSEYLYCTGWQEHQTIRLDRYHPSILPQPNDNQVTTNGLPSDNQVTTDGLPNISKYNISKSKDNIINNGRKLKKFPSHYVELRKQVFEGLQTKRGYKSRNPAAEALAISQMLDEKLLPDDILKGYDILKGQKFWQDKNLTMMSVRKDIHEVLKNGSKKSGRQPRQPEEYTDPEELRKQSGW